MNFGRVFLEKEIVGLVCRGKNSDGLLNLEGTMGIGGLDLKGIVKFSIVESPKLEAPGFFGRYLFQFVSGR